MATLIDASVLIAAERGLLDWDDILAEHEATAVAVAAITASVLLHGVHRATSGRIRARREAFVERVLARLPVIPFDLAIARVHADIWAHLAMKGISVGAHDLLAMSRAFRSVSLVVRAPSAFCALRSWRASTLTEILIGAIMRNRRRQRHPFCRRRPRLNRSKEF